MRLSRAAQQGRGARRRRANANAISLSVRPGAGGGCKLLVCCPLCGDCGTHLRTKVSGKNKKKGTLWCAGTVLQASTEETEIRVGARRKKIGTGWVLVRYDAHDGEEAEEDWKLVKPSEYGARRQKAGCWCLEQPGRAKFGDGDVEGLSDLDDDEDESVDYESDLASLGSGCGD